MARIKSRAEQFADLEDRVHRDYDPEDDPTGYSNDDTSNDSADDVDVNAGRKHYAAVEKSKLRNADLAPLGPQYSGSRVSRDAVNGDEEEEHDPFADYDDDDAGSEDALDLENGELENDEEELEDDEDEEKGTDDTSLSQDSSASDMSLDDDDEDAPSTNQIDRAQLKTLLHSESTNVAATLAQASAADAEKGRAIKRQRKTFNSILNSRIRLQQGLIAVNSLAAEEVRGTASQDDVDVADAVKTAEQAALKLWNTLESLRTSIEEARTGEKRKRVAVGSETSTSAIWQRMQESEAASLPHRRSILQKWSSKTQTASAQPTRGKLTGNTAAANATILDMLDSHLSNPEPLVARTRVPRSCAPVQAAAAAAASSASNTNAPATASATIYDDADFYSTLLTTLLAQHSLTTTTTPSAPAHQQIATLVRDAKLKTKKPVDVKASKGRKLRYTVHEPLQNYMAPEDRGNWSERARGELVGGLLGRREQVEERAGLGVGDELGEDGVGMDLREEEGLMLFRN